MLNTLSKKVYGLILKATDLLFPRSISTKKANLHASFGLENKMESCLEQLIDFVFTGMDKNVHINVMLVVLQKVFDI